MVESITVFLSAVMGGLAMSTPISLAWAEGTASLEMELLVHSLPRATAAGGVAAIITVGFATTTASTRIAWLLAFGGSSILLANHLLGQNFSGFAPLTTLNFVDCIAGGIVLGGIISAVQRRRFLMLLAALGAIAAIMVRDLSVSDAEFSGTAGDSPLGWFVIDTPSMVLIAPTAALILWCAYVYGRPRPEDLDSVELPLRPILAVLVITTSTVVGSSYLIRDGSTPYDALPVALVTVVAALLSALLLPYREGEMVLCSVAVAAAGGATFLLPLTGWMVPMLLAAGVAGMVLGTYRPRPLAAIIGSAGLSLFAVSTVDANGPGAPATVTGCLVLTLLVGYSLASSLARNGASALVLGILVLCLPGVAVAVRARIFGVGFALPRRWEVPTAYGEADVLLFALTGVVALIVAVGCAFALLVLHRLRSPVPRMTGEDQAGRVAEEGEEQGMSR